MVGNVLKALQFNSFHSHNPIKCILLGTFYRGETKAYISQMGQRINIKELVGYQMPDLDLHNPTAKALNPYTRQVQGKGNKIRGRQHAVLVTAQ